MNIFRRNIRFSDQDPLANGLGEEIVAEQQESEAFSLSDISGEELASQWDAIMQDVEKDPDWFSFNND